VVIAACEADISDDAQELRGGTWSGQAVGSGTFIAKQTQHLCNDSTDTDPPADFLCPITYELMKDPVTCADGHSYERTALEHWALTLGYKNSPLTGVRFERLATSIVPNHALRKQIEAWRASHSEEAATGET